jgi:hypothetical protein
MRAALALLVLVAVPSAARADEPRDTMRRVFDALTVLLPASLEPEQLADPARRDALQISFEQLSGATRALARHGASRDAGFGSLSRSLAEDAEQAADRFARGRSEEAAFRVQQLTQHCVACHSRLPSAREFPLADQLLGRVELDALGAEDRARLFVAVRRFDGALGAWEALFADPSVPPAAMDQGGPLVDYLSVAVRNQGSLERAERTLRSMAARVDAPRYLRTRLTSYADALRELRSDTSAGSKLERAEALAARAGSLNDFPLAHDGLVLDLQASALLHQYVDEQAAAGRKPDADLARAFWLLGVIEDRTVSSGTFPQTEAYMEAALRAAPRGPYAQRAYERIEEAMLVDYGAMRLDELPETARARLTELTRVLEEPKS